MITSIFKYSSVTAKVRVMFGRMLDAGDYRELTAKKSVTDIAVYLKQNPFYGPILEQVNESTIRRVELEKILRRSLIQDYIKLLKFIKGDVRTFLRLAILRYEIENVKMLLRVLSTENNIHIAMDSLMFLKKYDTVDLDKLSASRNIPEFIQNLKGSVYYKVLSPFAEGNQRLNLFSAEMSLDLYFFTLVWKQKDKLLKGQDRDVVLKSLGSEIDILNLMWIYRSKKYYNISREILYSFLIPYRHRLSRAQLKSMVEAKDFDELERLVKNTKYASVFKKGNEYLLDINITDYLYRLYKINLRNNYFSLSPILAYIHLKEIEIQNIISIIEGVRYGLSQEEISRFIVGI